MRVRLFIQGLTCSIGITILTACGSSTTSHWVLLDEDSDGKPTFIDAESVRMKDEGIAVYRRAVGDSLAADRVEFLQALDCVNLRWTFLTLDETLLDSMAGADLSSEEWSMVAPTPANRVLLDEVCRGFSPTRWIRVFRTDSKVPGELKEVSVDRETITGPMGDTVRTEMENLGYSEEILRSWSRWMDVSPDSGYLEIQADVACDKDALRYLENSRFSQEGELVHRADTPDLWFPIFYNSFEYRVFDVVCELGELFRPQPTPGTSPEGG